MTEKPERQSWLGDARAAFDAPLAWMSLILGVASGVSAVARLFEVGLRGVFNDFIQYYRRLIGPLYEWVNIPPWPFEVPPFVVDLFALYAVLFGMCVRFENHASHFNANRDLQKMTGRLSREAWTRLRERYSLRSILLRSAVLWTIVTALPLRLYFDPLVNDARARLAGLAQTDVDGKEWADNSVGGYVRSRRRAVWAFVLLPFAMIVFFLLNAYA